MEKRLTILAVATLILACNAVALAGSPYATNPEPPDGSVHDATFVLLIWTAGEGASTHDLYLGSYFDDVNEMDASVKRFRTNPAGCSELVFGLVRGTMYYWRIMEQPTGAVGPIWRFTVVPFEAWNPRPPDGAVYVPLDVQLAWNPGSGAFLHAVYFGADFDDVNDAVFGYHKHLQMQPDANWSPTVDGGLTIEYGATYYWRIDETSDGSKWYKGDTWSFTVVPNRTYYVDWDAPDNNDGSNWYNAFHYLQDALTAANSVDEPVDIVVAEGTYRPDRGAGITPGDRMATFQLINGVTIRGGYAGYGEANPCARDVDAYQTILSGDLDGNDIDVDDPCDLPNDPSRAENSYHVVSASGTNGVAALDGFTISGGNANGSIEWPFVYRSGGGMYNWSNSPTVNNCTFNGNLADWGGGMFTWTGDPTLTNCTFEGNWARWGGGGMYSETRSPTLINCKFIVNWAADGGAWLIGVGTATVTNCIFIGNSAVTGGGIGNGGTPVLLNCIFSGNSASSEGGGMINLYTSGSPTLVNCILEENSANWGGAMFNEESNPRLISCVFKKNSAQESGGGICNRNWVYPELTNCTFIANVAGHDGGAMGNEGTLGGPTLVTNCTFIGNSAQKGNSLACTDSCADDATTVRFANCILWDGGNEIWNGDDSRIVITYSDVQGGWLGEGNIDADPCFAEPGFWDPNGTPDDANDDYWVDGDYHLKSEAGRWEASSQTWVQDDATSLCIDAGNPGCPIGSEPAPNGNRINMGAYGGTAEASKSPENWALLADLTNDHKVNFGDLAIFARYWLVRGPCIPGDLTRDRHVDMNDLEILTQYWLGGPPPFNSNSIVCYGVEYYMQTDKFAYCSGQNVEMLYRVTNLSGRPVRFDFPHVQQCYFEVRRLLSTVVWYWPGILLPMCTSFTLMPGEFREFSVEWDMTCKDTGNPVGLGHYDVTGVLLDPAYPWQYVPVSVQIWIGTGPYAGDSSRSSAPGDPHRN